MKKLFIAVAILCSASLSFGQGLLKRVEGNGKVITENRSVENFNELTNSGSFDVIVREGSERSVKVEADENIQPYIETVVKGNKLVIRSKMHVNLRPSTTVKIYVTAAGLKSVRVSGSGNLRSENQLKADGPFEVAVSGSGNADVDVQATSVDASVSGSGNLSLKGKTSELDGRISGSGNIRAKQLQSQRTELKISGSGNAEVVANEKLDTRISGSGEVHYWGNASVESKIAGSGSVKKEH